MEQAGVNNSSSWAVKVILLAVLVASAAAFATRRDFYVEALVDPFFGLALFVVSDWVASNMLDWMRLRTPGPSTCIFAVI